MSSFFKHLLPFFAFGLSIAQYVNITCKDPPLNSYPYCNPKLPIDQRVDDLLSRLTLREKVFLQNSDQGGVPRLGVPTLGHSECNHGTFVSFPPYTPYCKQNITIPGDFPLTAFPQAINAAGAFSPELIGKMARAISNEVRAKYNTALKFGCVTDNGFGIACWAPMINICRDPRWGRCQEGYGEDPVLMSKLVAHFIPNLQHDPNVPDYFQSVSTCKHFAGFSGPGNMVNGDAIINYRDWKLEYLPAFKTCVEAGVSSFMCSYSSTNGVPNCANEELLGDILRDEWGFDGYVTGDCGAVQFIYKPRGVARNYVEAAEMAIKAGCDWVGSCLGPDPTQLDLSLIDGVEQGTIPIQYLDKALKRVLPFWFKLGLIDNPITNPWSDLTLSDTYKQHMPLAFEMAVKSMILFKNDDYYLPIDFKGYKGKTIAVIGPCADNDVCYSGDYNAIPLYFLSPLDALKNNYNGQGINFVYVAGCNDTACSSPQNWNEVTDAVKKSDIVFYIGGISTQQETENLDRLYIEMPTQQGKLFETVYNATINGNIPIISILCYGTPVIDHLLNEKSVAILGAGYGGERIGDGVVGLLNGSYVPSGRSTVTWYNSTTQLPNASNYDLMYGQGRTYKYLKEEPLYPFGFGLSYTRFKYFNLKLSETQIKPCDNIMVNVDIINNGSFIGDESILIYMNILNKTYSVDNIRLVNFTRMEQIVINKQVTVNLEINPRWMTVIETYTTNELIIPGVYQVQVGNNLKYNSNIKTFETSLKANFTIVGEPTNIKSCM